MVLQAHMRLVVAATMQTGNHLPLGFTCLAPGATGRVGLQLGVGVASASSTLEPTRP